MHISVSSLEGTVCLFSRFCDEHLGVQGIAHADVDILYQINAFVHYVICA